MWNMLESDVEFPTDAESEVEPVAPVLPLLGELYVLTSRTVAAGLAGAGGRAQTGRPGASSPEPPGLHRPGEPPPKACPAVARSVGSA